MIRAAEIVRNKALPIALLLGVETALMALLTRYGDFFVHGNALKFVGLFAAASTAWFFATRLLKRLVPPLMAALLFWTAAIALRLAIFAMPAGDDVWRYIWEGRIQWHGFNPYLLNPQAPELTPLRDALWLRINHPDWAAIYPPGAQILMAALARISESPWFFKLIFTAADLLGVALLLRLNGGDHRLTAWYAWNPLVVASFAGAGHCDSLMVLAMIAAVEALGRNRPAASCLWLGAAIALKVVPVFLVPVWLFALGRRSGWLVLAGAIPWLLALFYGGLGVVAKPLTDFTHVTRFNDALWWLIEETVWPNPAQRNERYNLVLLASVIVIAVIFRRDWRRALLWVLGAALLLSPALHPWYLTWILPFACWRRAWPWFALSISVVASLLVWEAGPFWGVWQITWPLRLIILLPPMLALAGGLNDEIRMANGPERSGAESKERNPKPE